MTEITHHFNVINQDGFINKLKALAKRFKVGYLMAWGIPYSREVEISKWNDPITVWFFPVDVTFSFDSFKIEGYKYLGCIKDSDMLGFITIHGKDATEGMNLSEWVKSFDTIPCHACNRKHSRKIGHLFQEDNTGEIKVFGSSCAKKYFGINFDRILSFFETLNTRYDEWDKEFFGAFVSNHLDTLTVLKDIYYIIDLNGYISKSRSEEQYAVDSTAEVSKVYSSDSAWKKSTKEKREELTKNIDFSVLWNTFYVKDAFNVTEFEHNIGVIQDKMSKGLLTTKDYGWISYMVWNQFFKPAPAEKVDFIIPEGLEAGMKVLDETVTFTGFTYFDGTWGRTYINTFINGDVRYKWFSSINTADKYGVENGDRLFIKKATIKKIEDDPKFGKSVIITRPTIRNI
jgi:hypothetical protein